jgi:GNAT superfamily N-acetyltransferase
MSLYEEPSPLAYKHGYAVVRFGLLERDLIDVPFDRCDVYFAATERKERYGKNGRRLRVPRVETISGARPGTLAWVDWHRPSADEVYIDFMKTRSDWRSRGAGQQLIEAFYARVVVNGILVNWGRVVHEHAWKIKQRMERAHPSVRHVGHVDFVRSA